MIPGSENTDSPKKTPKKRKRFWLKFSVAVAIILFILWLILYLFSNFLFNAVIKKTFSELTDQQYSLSFKNLKINIFTQEIIFFDTQIIKSEKEDLLNRPTITFRSDTLLFSSIDIQAFRKNQILKFEKLHINKLKLVLENINDKTDNQRFRHPLSPYLTQLKISSFKISEAEINYKQETDSIYIPALSFEILHLSIDSLRDTVTNNRFHYTDIELGLKKQQLFLPDKSHLLYLNSLKLSTKEKSLEFDSFNIKPFLNADNEQIYTVDIPKFKLENFEFDSLINKKQFLAKSLVLDINYLNIHIKNDSNKSLNSDLKKQLDDLFNKNFSKIYIDSGQISIAKSQIMLPNNQQLNFSGNSRLYIDNFKFDPKNKSKYSLVDGNLSLNNFVFYNSLNKQKLQFKLGQLNYFKQRLNINGFDFVSDSSEAYNLQIKEVQLDKINWIQLLNTYKLSAENLRLTGGDMVQLRVSKSNSSIDDLDNLNSIILPIFKSVKVNTIQFEDWNYNLPSKAILAKNINAQLNLFQLPGNTSMAFGIFSNFNTEISQFSWVSKDQKHHYLANNIEANSQSQYISIDKIQSFPRWKTLENEPLDGKARFKVFGENIKIKTQKPFHQIRLNDTLTLSKLSVDSLNLKQFGKNIREEKLKSNIPPIFISSFELGNGDFAAYNDSSIISRLAEVNGIHLQGDSLEIYSDKTFLLNYSRLIAVTKNGFYQNKAQGLNFNFKKIDFDSKDEAMELHQFKAEIISDKNDKSTHHQLDSKLVQIKGFDHNLFLQRSLISAKEFMINTPTVISKSIAAKKQQQIDFHHFFSAQNLQQLSYLEFDRFIIRDFTWLATYTVNGITNITTFERANFEAVDFRLSHRSFTNPDRIFFSQSIDFNIGNLRQHFQNGNYLLMVKDIEFSSLQKLMNFDKIQFYTLQKADQNNYNFTIDQISFNKINFADFQRNFSLTIENILVQEPISKLRFFGFDESSKAVNLNTLELYNIIRPYFSQITFNKIDVRDMTLRIDVPKGSSTNIYNLGHLNLQMQDFRIDSTTKAFKNNRFFYSQNTLVHLQDYSAQISNDLYRLYFKDLRLSTLSGVIDIDNISLKPLYNYADFAKRVEHQTDRFDIEVDNIKLLIDFQDALFRQKYIMQRADINRLIGEIYRDGLYPRLPDFYPLNPLQRLLDLPYFIQIDSLLVNDAYFAYKEKGGNTEEPGLIYFDKLNALVLNASNNPDFIKFGGNTVLNAQALLMGKSKLVLDANFPLLDHGKSFKLYAHLNRIEMDDLEPILRPLALIQARSGTIKSIELSVKANDDYAFGNMYMYYDNMKVEILNKSMKKGFFSTFFANAMIKTENPSYLIPRKGPIYFERNKMRSIFNYWAEISILGMKTSMGLADRRIAKKVKKLQEK